MRFFLGLFTFLAFIPLKGQNISSSELLQKTITFHDPNGHWNDFKGQLKITLQMPNSSDRISNVHINLPREHFISEVEQDNDRFAYILEKDSCRVSWNGKANIPEDIVKKYRLTCESAQVVKNYYTYLYGLPMKLNDPGTRIDPKVEKRTFKGKEYLVLKVDYEADVGSDTWYFYFDPSTYAMQVYQFYHDESKNDGEYILLNGLEEVNGIKMPKVRKWYYNKNDKYLGTDILGDL